MSATVHNDAREHRALFNPAAVALVLARQCEGGLDRGRPVLPLSLACVGALIAFHPRARMTLPSTIRTSFVTWLERNPQARVDVAASLRGSHLWLRQGLTFALAHGVCAWVAPSSLATGPSAPSRRISGESEMAEMQRSAYFLGRWLPEAGSEATVMALLGMRP